MDTLFHPNRNCWRVVRASHVSILVDYGNYYRDLRESILKARKSIFVLGWDIDSRIELLRGKDAAGQKNVTFFDLIADVARRNPDLQIYLNKWDYSVFFMQQREPFWMRHWTSLNLPNIHLCLDDVLPLGGCHHQKVVVIDDEVAFWGGMDVALGRWDFRQHHVKNRHRADPTLGIHGPDKEHFGPYHDIQAVLAGPAARALAELARERWRVSCPRMDLPPLEPPAGDALPQCWPDTDPPDFRDMNVAIARTMPKLKDVPQTEEIIRLLVDEIGSAKKFIYIENQFLCSLEIAQALNRRLREIPDLKVLLISCHQPQGIMERKAMWGGRVRFRDILESGGAAGRTAMAYPASRENGKEATVRIHSKLMIVDDRFLHIGSANINNRSMGMDTECDVTLIGETDEQRRKIAAVRNDLIREHTGYEAEEIDRMVHESPSAKCFLEEKSGSRQHLRAIDDSAYRDERFISLAIALADPRRPLITAGLTRFPEILRLRQWKGRRIWGTAAIAAVVLLMLPLLWAMTGLGGKLDTETVAAFLGGIEQSPLAFLLVLGIYIAGGLVFFPVTVLSAAVILVFGGLKGLAFAMAGALASGMTGYLIGRALGRDRVEQHFPRTRGVLKKIRMNGLAGVALLRSLPVAPFSLMNMLLGAIKIPLWVFLTGSFFGLLPGMTMLAIFGASLKDSFADPNLITMGKSALFFAAWIAVIVLCNKLAHRWQERHETDMPNGKGAVA